ncbi:DUF6777 domain-containing protein [Streptomyces sp. NPDC093094]|uniref:DUF6777 domain-containing protein n=1 Tax=Streptomyces sp. NPDC093094 TaxID=3366026 RepID=UPI00380578FF
MPEFRRENVVRSPGSPIRTLVVACALSTVLLSTGCGDDGPGAAGGGVVLQPAGVRGPDPFTPSTDIPSPQPSPVPSPPRRQAAVAAPRSVSGTTPGLYAGTPRTGSCDVRRQIGHLTADPARAGAFAAVEGVAPRDLPGYLRGLTPVVLRADTRVGNHGYKDGRATGYQAVLQAGTAVLVDTRGVPRVRCACGNPLLPPAGSGPAAVTEGTSWSGYRPAEVVVVTPAPRAVTGITIVDIAGRTWIERRCGHDTRHDRSVPPPAWATRPPAPSDPASPGTPVPLTSVAGTPSPSPSPSPGTSRPYPRDLVAPPDSSVPSAAQAGCAAPTVTVTPGAARPAASPAATGCPSAAATSAPPPAEPPSPPGTGTAPGDETSGDVGPEAVPDSPDVPDGGGLIPDDRAGTESVSGGPADVFDG